MTGATVGLHSIRRAPGSRASATTCVGMFEFSRVPRIGIQKRLRSHASQRLHSVTAITWRPLSRNGSRSYSEVTVFFFIVLNSRSCPMFARALAAVALAAASTTAFAQANTASTSGRSTRLRASSGASTAVR